ncbi:hypothetical protein F5Y14DRAFT_295856 [Nemania sp. NC0429]|nr:hypothetical protein F5Y14DRAFT_295856 [Nemania sp. NC0429]
MAALFGLVLLCAARYPIPSVEALNEIVGYLCVPSASTNTSKVGMLEHDASPSFEPIIPKSAESQLGLGGFHKRNRLQTEAIGLFSHPSRHGG